MRGAFFLRSDCDKGQQSDASKCYVATCPTGEPDGYRSCTCWAYQTCTAEVHCAVKSGEALPPNCSRAAAIWSPQNSSQEFYSWNPRGSNCLNATINCVAAMEYYCPRGGSSGGGSGGEAACIKCGMGPHRAAFLAANCTDESIAQVCRGNTAGSKSSSGTIHAIDSDSSTAEVPGPQPPPPPLRGQQQPRPSSYRGLFRRRHAMTAQRSCGVRGRRMQRWRRECGYSRSRCRSCYSQAQQVAAYNE
jgi:hypothetical protein